MKLMSLRQVGFMTAWIFGFCIELTISFPVQETGRESISTSDHAHSSASKEDGRTSEDGHGSASEADNIKEDAYEEAFGRMKKAAGVSDVDEVVRRFETQEETANHLQELQARAEKEIREEAIPQNWNTVLVLRPNLF